MTKPVLAVFAIGLSGIGASVAAADIVPAAHNVAPMRLQCTVPPSELPPAGTQLTNAQISALCELPGAVKP